MLELKLKKFTLQFDFSFFAVISLMLLFHNDKYVIMCLFACIWHETGHLLAMILNKIEINKICMYGGGIKILPDKMFDFISVRVQVFVYIAGSMINFITYMLFQNVNSDNLSDFAYINAVIGAFNMLPLQFLDGGKLLLTVVRYLCCYQHAIMTERYLKHINIVLILIFILIWICMGNRNITIFATFCCLLLSALSDS